MKLNLVVIYAADLSRSVAFYESLGINFVEEQHGSGPKHFSGELEGTVLEIYPANAELSEQSIRLGFVVTKSIDDLVAHLKQSGTKIISMPKVSPWGRRAVVVDPNGYRVEITEK